MASDQKGQDELPLPDGERRARAEEQIKSNARVVDYSIREILVYRVFNFLW